MHVAVVISCRSVVDCAATSLPSFQLVWLNCFVVKVLGTYALELPTVSGLHFNQKQPVSNSLFESGPLLARYGCIPRPRASKMLIISIRTVTLAQKAVHVDSVLKRGLFLPLLLKTHENIAVGYKSRRGSAGRRT